MIKQSETNYATQENVISALKQANKEKNQALDDFVESNMMLRKRIAMLEAEIESAKQYLQKIANDIDRL